MNLVMADLNPFLLAANTPEPDPRLLPLLHSKPELASQQDAHGYSLLHAAASYNHTNLLRHLVHDFKVDVNLKDEDNETALFVAETVEVVRCLVEELHIDTTVKNEDDQTALEKIEAEGDYPAIAQYLGGAATTNGTASLPPLPPKVSITANAATEDSVAEGQEPDPEFRRRIEELAAKENFQTEEGQKELRELITDAVRGASDDREVRRRLG